MEAMTTLAILFAAAAVPILSGPLAVQAQVPPDIATKIRAIGRKVDPEGTARIYAPLQKKKPYAGVKMTRDIHFGPGPRDTFDLFVPEDAGGGPRPVLIFVHGGAFVGGDKNQYPDGTPSPFYDNIMLWGVNHGMIGVNMNYELAPKAQYPAVQKDIATVIRWVQENAGRYGADPKRVFLWGHSAGASHVASYVAHPEYYPAGGPGLSGAIMSSGSYDFAAASAPGGRGNHPYFGDASTLGEKSSVPGLLKTNIPLFVVAAELDPEGMIQQARELNDVLCKQGRCPEFMILKDHGHISESYCVNTSDESLTGPLLTFMQRAKY